MKLSLYLYSALLLLGSQLQASTHEGWFGTYDKDGEKIEGSSLFRSSTKSDIGEHYAKKGDRAVKNLDFAKAVDSYWEGSKCYNSRSMAISVVTTGIPAAVTIAEGANTLSEFYEKFIRSNK